MIIDLHTHSYPRSDDSLISPGELVAEAKRVGLDAICLTDHDGFWCPEEVAALSEEHDFPIFPGCEVTTEEGHLLVFGLERYIFGMHRASFVRDLVDRAGGVVVVAHPYRRRFREREVSDEEAYYAMVEEACRSNVFSLADGVEVLNGRGSTAENAFSFEIAERFDLKGTGSSDAHRLDDVGTFATEFDAEITMLPQLIGELKQGNYRPLALQKRRTV